MSDSFYDRHPIIWAFIAMITIIVIFLIISPPDKWGSDHPEYSIDADGAENTVSF